MSPPALGMDRGSYRLDVKTSLLAPRSYGVGKSLSLIYYSRVAPHCVNTLRILHAAYDATIETWSLSLSLSLSHVVVAGFPG